MEREKKIFADAEELARFAICMKENTATSEQRAKIDQNHMFWIITSALDCSRRGKMNDTLETEIHKVFSNPASTEDQVLAAILGGLMSPMDLGRLGRAFLKWEQKHERKAKMLSVVIDQIIHKLAAEERYDRKVWDEKRLYYLIEASDLVHSGKRLETAILVEGGPARKKGAVPQERAFLQGPGACAQAPAKGSLKVQ